MNRLSPPLGIAALLCAIVVVSNAGPLDPPSGPVDSTYKTLDEVEPRTVLTQAGGEVIVIDQPGSYTLGESFTPIFSGVIIRSGRVTLDLNGFEIRGDSDQQFTPEYGVLIDFEDTSVSPVTIRNGTITGFTGAAIKSISSSVRVTVEDVTCGQGEEGGIDIQSEGAVRRCSVVTTIATASPAAIALGAGVIEDCLVRATVGDGYRLGSGEIRNSRAQQVTGAGFVLGGEGGAATVIARNCTALRADAQGFHIVSPATLIGCAARLNDGVGFESDAPVSFRECLSVENGGSGFSVVNRATFHACTATSNGADGFRQRRSEAPTTLGSSASVFTDCLSASNTNAGFDLDNGALVRGCTAESNAVGFVTLFGATISDSHAQANSGHGFDTGPEVTITDCTAVRNGGDGFRFAIGGRAFNCSAHECQGIGFLAGTRTTIDSCTATGCDVGFSEPGPSGGAVFVRNTASSNTTDYDIANANHGPIIDRTASSGVISTSNPLANIRY
ncbi:MAG: hypothetical protein Tsb0013_08490 [Phycisphaerales bacterium]